MLETNRTQLNVIIRIIILIITFSTSIIAAEKLPYLSPHTDNGKEIFTIEESLGAAGVGASYYCIRVCKKELTRKLFLDMLLSGKFDLYLGAIVPILGYIGQEDDLKVFENLFTNEKLKKAYLSTNVRSIIGAIGTLGRRGSKKALDKLEEMTTVEYWENHWLVKEERFLSAIYEPTDYLRIVALQSLYIGDQQRALSISQKIIAEALKTHKNPERIKIYYSEKDLKRVLTNKVQIEMVPLEERDFARLKNGYERIKVLLEENDFLKDVDEISNTKLDYNEYKLSTIPSKYEYDSSIKFIKFPYGGPEYNLKTAAATTTTTTIPVNNISEDEDSNLTIYIILGLIIISILVFLYRYFREAV